MTGADGRGSLRAVLDYPGLRRIEIAWMLGIAGDAAFLVALIVAAFAYGGPPAVGSDTSTSVKVIRDDGFAQDAERARVRVVAAGDREQRVRFERGIERRDEPLAAQADEPECAQHVRGLDDREHVAQLGRLGELDQAL